MEQLLTPRQLAAVLGISVQTLYNRRSYGGSLPPAVHIGRLVRYRESEVQAWINALSRHPVQAESCINTCQSDKPIRRGRPTKAEEVRRRTRY